MKKYLIIESTNGNLSGLKEICKDSDSLKFLGELKGSHLIIKSDDKSEVPTYLMTKAC